MEGAEELRLLRFSLVFLGTRQDHILNNTPLQIEHHTSTLLCEDHLLSHTLNMTEHHIHVYVHIDTNSRDDATPTTTVTIPSMIYKEG